MVWNTILFFFQAFLLAGYSYSLCLLRLRLVSHRVLLTSALLLLSLVFLPISVSVSIDIATLTNPTLWLLLYLCLNLGLPLLMVAATAPLVQAWFSQLKASSPYFLYAVSNAGSFAALFGFLCF